jgi:hypothetical protein
MLQQEKLRKHQAETVRDEAVVRAVEEPVGNTAVRSPVDPAAAANHAVRT